MMDALVIGAGHAGLAASYCLTEKNVNHVVIERGEVANSWKKERWDSLKLLTPNWQSRLPGFRYQGHDPDGFMSMPEITEFLEQYAQSFSAPVRSHTQVVSVVPLESGYQVNTDRGCWHTRSVVIASGACNLPAIPPLAEQIPGFVEQVSAQEYRNPGQLAEGGVLVVGASASGLQLAEEIQRSGRPVTLSVGEHVRLPRTYRGRDIQWWMDQAGILDEGLDDVDDLNRVRHLPSPQLVGSRRRRILDINAMMESGITVVGRLAGIRDDQVQFSGALKNVCHLADLKMERLLRTIDDWIDQSGDRPSKTPAENFEHTCVPDDPCLGFSLKERGIKTILWATGYRPDYNWLKVSVTDRKGRIQHTGGVTEAAGLYVLGLPFLRRRKSTFIHGIEDDARHVTAHLDDYLKQENCNHGIH